jgi:hypothetical protein
LSLVGQEACGGGSGSAIVADRFVQSMRFGFEQSRAHLLTRNELKEGPFPSRPWDIRGGAIFLLLYPYCGLVRPAYALEPRL